MFIDINGVKVNYKVTGEGKNVVLLHGWRGDINSFEAVHSHLDKKFKTYSLDFPGFGSSDLPPEPWGIEEYTDLVEKFLIKLKVQRPILIGHSFGGRVAIRIASKNIIDVNKLVLVDSAGIKPKRSLNYYFKVYTYKTVKNLLRLPVLNTFADDILAKYRKKLGSADYQNAAGVVQKTLVKVVNEDLTRYLSQIKAPALLIWGENDTATPVSDGRIMERLIPDAGLVVLKNAGHFSYLEKMRDFLIILDEFLKKDLEGKSV